MGWTKKLKKNLKKLGKNIGKVYAAPYKGAAKLADKAGLKGISQGLEGQSDLLQGKSAKKALKKIGKGAKAVVPAVLGIAGGSAILGDLGSKLTGALPQGFQNAVGGASDFLSKAGKYAEGIKGQLDQVAGMLVGDADEQQLAAASPNLPDSMEPQGPAAVAEAAPRAGGFDGKTIAIVAAAGVAVLLLMRKR